MRVTQQLVASILTHIRESLQAAHTPDVHRDMLEGLGTLAKALELEDEEEALLEITALAEAIDFTISDEEISKGSSDEDPDDEQPEDDDTTNPE